MDGIRLLDYGALAQAPPPRRPVLVVPSLVNRSYIMDLMENGSFLRFLASRGLRPLLIDWGDTGADTGDDLSNEDRKMLAELLCHCADVSNPCKPWEVSKNWSDRVIEEFFAQGDREKEAGLVVSANMDRETTHPARVAVGEAA